MGKTLLVETNFGDLYTSRGSVSGCGPGDTVWLYQKRELCCINRSFYIIGLIPNNIFSFKLTVYVFDWHYSFMRYHLNTQVPA